METKVVGSNNANPDVVMSLSVPNKVLYSWHANSGDSYIELLNDSVHHGAVKIKSDASRLQAVIRVKVDLIKAKYNRMSWRERQLFFTKCSSFDIMHNELISVSQLESQIKELNGIVEGYRYVA